MLKNFRTQTLQFGDIVINFCHGGDGPPLLLLHGYPQTHVIWHKVADELAKHYTLVMPDLRGYGDSSKPAGLPDHCNYSKRAMAQDMCNVMQALGHESFYVCGHDRGGRVAHRLALDHPHLVKKLMLLDISPTSTMYERTDQAFATLYYHWFFLIQAHPLPETLIAGNPEFYLNTTLGGWGSASMQIFDARAISEYQRCFCTPQAIHAACEDYRAAASIDLEHDRQDDGKLIACPVHVLWGERGIVHRLFQPLADWQEKCSNIVSGCSLPAGHFIPEESPQALIAEIKEFFGGM